MPILRCLQHWLTGRGPCLQVADFVPETHPLRQWAETFPWAALGHSRGPLVRPALPQTHHAWTAAGLDAGAVGVGVVET
jgi:hypothetical protein